MALIKLLVEGGAMAPGPAIAQQLGPLGINIGKVISDVNLATSHFKGVTVPVHLNVDPAKKTYIIKVLSPPTSELLKKELKIEKGSEARMKHTIGNLAIEQIISVSKAKHDNLLSNSFLATVKSVIGTCQAIGTLIENKEAKEVMEEIKQGKYKKEINSQKTNVEPEKRKALDAFFSDIAGRQEAAKKAEEAEKAAAEEAKAAAAVAAPVAGVPAVAAPGAAKTATPVAAAKPVAAKPAAGAKK